MEEGKRIIDEWEDESFDMLDSFAEKDNKKNEAIIKEAKEKISKLFAEAKEWLEENTKEEKVKENLTKTKEEATRIVSTTKETVIEISENENFKEAVKNGKGFILSTGSLINDGLKAGRKQLEKNEKMKTVFDKADEKIDDMKQSEELKKAVDKAEETAKKVSDALFTTVRKFFEENKEEEE